MRKPLSITHGNGGGIQPEDTNRQSLLGTQVRTPGSNVVSLAQTVDKDIWELYRGKKENLSGIWAEELLGLDCENTSEFEKQNMIGKPMNSTAALDENDVTHKKMMELDPLLEASGERNLRSINLIHGERPFHCLAQTVWYPKHSNLCLIWDVEEVRSIG